MTDSDRIAFEDEARRHFRQATAELYEAFERLDDTELRARAIGHFHERAIMVRADDRLAADGRADFMTIDDFYNSLPERLAGRTLTEAETGHRAEIYGHVAQVASHYETWLDDMHNEGVNFFSFFFDGENWKIASIVWDNVR